MPKPEKDSVETIKPDDPRNEWPGTAKALAMTGLSQRTLENMVRTGAVHYVYDEAKNRKFNPDSLAEVAGVVSEKATENELTTAIVAESRKTIKDLSEANAKLLRLATSPAFRAMRILKNENAALRARCSELETKHLQNIEAFEAALNESHKRELERVQAEAREKRYDAGFNKLLEQVPSIVEQVTFKRTIDSLLTTLTPDQQGLLFEMLTDQQKALLMRIMKQRGSAETPKESKT